MGGSFDLLSQHPRTVFSAGVASLALHGSLLIAVFGGAQTLTDPSALSPLRFSGQTFDVDSLSETAEDVSPPTSTAAPSGKPALQEEQHKEEREQSSPPPPTDEGETTLAQTLPQPAPSAPPRAAASDVERAPAPESPSEPSENPRDI